VSDRVGSSLVDSSSKITIQTLLKGNLGQTLTADMPFALSLETLIRLAKANTGAVAGFLR
jgi:hypothetical protein